MSETAKAQWIVGRGYDLAWFFGGAAVSLAVLGLTFAAGVPIVVLFWIWTLGFDGPHIGAAFTRTYTDREEWRVRPRVLLISLLAFLVGPLFLLATAVSGSADPFTLFLGAATFYAYYHVVRQHYGFLALYKARNGDRDPVDLRVDRTFLYVGCWAPYFYFLLTHPRTRVLLHLPAQGPYGLLERIALIACLAAWGLTLLVFAVRLFRRPRVHVPPTAYLLLTVLLYSVVYFFVARFEPVYAQSRGPDQDFLLLSIVVGIFHNIQYIGLVWFHNRNRYGAGGDYGAAAGINRSWVRYLACILLFSGVVYLFAAASTGVFPGIHFGLQTRWGPVTPGQVGLCLWWGLALNHYYLDQKIWRIRGDETLKKNLGLARDLLPQPRS